MLCCSESNATVGDGHARLGNSVGEFRPAPLLDISPIVLQSLDWHALLGRNGCLYLSMCCDTDGECGNLSSPRHGKE